MNKFYFTLHAVPITFLVSILSLQIEKKSRRGPLAFYVANIATESFFRMMVGYGVVKPIPKGDVLLFTTSMAILLYQIKQQGYGRDPVSMALKIYLGRDEAGSRHVRRENSLQGIEDGTQTSLLAINSHQSTVTSAFDDNSNLTVKKNQELDVSTILEKLLSSKHESCRHRDKTCLLYSANGFYKPFLATWVGYTALGLVRKYQEILSRPSLVIERLFSGRNIRFGLFFGSFSAIYKAVSCYLRYHSNGDQDWHALVAGAAAGPSMLISPNSTIALYIFLKFIATIFWK